MFIVIIVTKKGYLVKSLSVCFRAGREIGRGVV